MPFILIISVCFISFLFKGHSLRLSTYIANILFSKKKKQKNQGTILFLPNKNLVKKIQAKAICNFPFCCYICIPWVVKILTCLKTEISIFLFLIFKWIYLTSHKTDHFLKREGKENTNKIQPKFTQSRFNLLFCIQCTDISTKSRSNAIKHWPTGKIQQVKYLINSCK